jgi:hypothetical protein
MLCAGRKIYKKIKTNTIKKKLSALTQTGKETSFVNKLFKNTVAKVRTKNIRLKLTEKTKTN